MEILLIGGNGFVGKALINELRKKRIKVTYISRSQNYCSVTIDVRQNIKKEE